jgi:hypothetical protein
VAGSGDAEVALQVSGRRDGENTGELGIATVQDIARRRGAAQLGFWGGQAASLGCCAGREACAVAAFPLLVWVRVLDGCAEMAV